MSSLSTGESVYFIIDINGNGDFERQKGRFAGINQVTNCYLIEVGGSVGEYETHLTRFVKESDPLWQNSPQEGTKY